MTVTVHVLVGGASPDDPLGSEHCAKCGATRNDILDGLVRGCVDPRVIERRREMLMGIEAAKHLFMTARALGDQAGQWRFATKVREARGAYRWFEQMASRPGFVFVDPLHGMV